MRWRKLLYPLISRNKDLEILAKTDLVTCRTRPSSYRVAFYEPETFSEVSEWLSDYNVPPDTV